MAKLTVAQIEHQEELNIPLHNACYDGDYRKAQEAITNGADINFNYGVSVTDFGLDGESYDSIESTSLIQIASRNNQFEIVKLLAMNWADLDAENNNNEIMKHACEEGQLEVVKILNQHGVSNEMYIASENGHLNMVKYLVENGADVNSAIEGASSTLNENQDFKIINYLIENGADIDRGIAEAATWRNKHIINYLVEQGGDYDVAINNADGAFKQDLINNESIVRSKLEKDLIGGDLKAINQEKSSSKSMRI